MDLKVNSQNFTGTKKHIKNTINGAVSGAILGAAIQGVYCGVQLAKESKTMSKSALKEYSKPMLSSIGKNAKFCAILNAAIALGYSVYNSIKSKKN